MDQLLCVALPIQGQTMFIETKLFVSELSQNITEAHLLELFSQFGAVININIVTDKNSGNNRGFGFVEMGTKEQAQFAVEHFSKKIIENEKIQVSFSKNTK